MFLARSGVVMIRAAAPSQGITDSSNFRGSFIYLEFNTSSLLIGCPLKTAFSFSNALYL